MFDVFVGVYLKFDGIIVCFFGVFVFDYVLFDICCGEVYGLMGENGVGKLMLFKVLLGVN